MSTKSCPQCGSAVPAPARFCGQCGFTFVDIPASTRNVPRTIDEATTAPAPAPARQAFGKTIALGSENVVAFKPEVAPAKPANFGATVLDLSPFGAGEQPPASVPTEPPRPVPVPAPPPSVREPHKLGRTMIGGHTPVDGGLAAVQPAPAPAPAPPGSDKRTMIGMPASEIAALAAAAASKPEPAPAPMAIAPANRTMLGVAVPGIAPLNTAAPTPAAAQVPGGTIQGMPSPVAPGAPRSQPRPMTEPFAAPTPTPRLVSSQRSPAPGLGGGAPAPAAAPPPILPAPAPLEVEPLPNAPAKAKRGGVPVVVVVGIVIVLVALIGALAAFLVLRGSQPLAAQPQLEESGRESLRIRCPSCPDGTTISLGASSAKTAGFAAVLPLPAPLSIGDNDLELRVERPPPGRSETVRLHVPVAYRVKADLSTLTASPATITVRVEASPGTEVSVDGKPVTLDASGKASPTIDVSAEVEGPSDDAKTIDKRIPFTIKSKAAASESGQLVVRSGIIPLHLDAPGRELFTDRPSVSIVGQTKPGATITVDGQAAAVDPQGRFGVRTDLAATGEQALTIVSAAPPLAPRTVHAKVVRVATLDDAAKTLDGRSPLTFDAFAGSVPANVGKLVVVEGEVVEVRPGKGHTVLLIEEKKTCAASSSCIVRVSHGEELTLARGDAVRAYGRLLGTAGTGDKLAPDVEGALVVARGPRGAKK